MCDNSLSSKIALGSFLATIMVVYRHSLNYLAFFNSYTSDGLNGLIQDGCMRLTQIAVPFFFIVSGFFFFRKEYNSLGSWVTMLRTKGRTLFIPFLIWNVVGLLTLIVTRQDYTLSISELFLSEWYGPLWYVRDLMTLMFFVPFYQWLFGDLSNRIADSLLKVFLLVMSLVLAYYWKPVDTYWVSSEGLFFFMLGGLLQKNTFLLEKKIPLGISLFLYAAWLYFSFFSSNGIWERKICILVGLMVFWCVLNVMKIGKLKNFFQYSFIIYVLHFYLIKVMKIFLASLFYGNKTASLLAYLLLPLITAALIIAVAKILKRYFPVCYRTATGGR